MAPHLPLLPDLVDEVMDFLNDCELRFEDLLVTDDPSKYLQIAALDEIFGFVPARAWRLLRGIQVPYDAEKALAVLDEMKVPALRSATWVRAFCADFGHGMPKDSHQALVLYAKAYRSGCRCFLPMLGYPQQLTVPQQIVQQLHKQSNAVHGSVLSQFVQWAVDKKMLSVKLEVALAQFQRDYPAMLLAFNPSTFPPYATREPFYVHQRLNAFLQDNHLGQKWAVLQKRADKLRNIEVELERWPFVAEERREEQLAEVNNELKQWH